MIVICVARDVSPSEQSRLRATPSWRCKGGKVCGPSATSCRFPAVRRRCGQHRPGTRAAPATNPLFRAPPEGCPPACRERITACSARLWTIVYMAIAARRDVLKTPASECRPECGFHRKAVLGPCPNTGGDGRIVFRVPLGGGGLERPWFDTPFALGGPWHRQLRFRGPTKFLVDAAS
jgi:hypothetical protein